MKKHWADPELARLHTATMKGKQNRTSEYRAGVSQRMKAYYSNPDNRSKASELKSKFYDNPANRKRWSAIAHDHIEQISKASIDSWKRPEYRKKVMHRRTMSGSEQVFASICNQYGFEYKFVGNGKLWIGDKNPDFVHVSDNLVIEIWGDFFHKGQDPQKRIDHFRKFGYKCIVIWASDLCRFDDIAEKIRRFEQ